jgi:hypothetical protein
MDKETVSKSKIIARQGFSASFLLNKLYFSDDIQQNERMKVVASLDHR